MIFRRNYDLLRIQVLDPVCISKIAAGEVVERPASVVKELLENSIDAAATEIRVIIKNGGKDLIEIHDNGSGIIAEDLPLAIKRHTTSKIQNEDDLKNILTMGFRGEALYSIASVSRFSISSRTLNEDLATVVSTEGDVEKFTLSEEIMSSPGTTIRVRDLFFNFNVRRKFMKKASIEKAYIYEIVTQYAIANPAISFQLISDGLVEFYTIKTSTHLPAIKETLGSEIAQSIIDIGINQRNDISIQGYISKQGKLRRNRKYQYFFLNGRRITSNLLQEALEEGFHNYMMKGQYPIAFLFIEMPPDQYDVNIHPQKREVLFFDEPIIRNVVSSTIVHCLKTHTFMPQLSPISGIKQTKLPQTSQYSNNTSSLSSSRFMLEKISKFSELDHFLGEDISQKRQEPDLRILGSSVKYRGHLGKEFLILEDISTNDLIILDFHATSERINLEKITKMYKTKTILIQTLLDPFRVDLTPQQKVIVADSVADLSNFGFDLRFPKNSKFILEIHGIPQILTNCNLNDFFTDLFDNIPKTVVQDKIKDILNIIACHSAYRAGETLSYRQVQELLSDLLKTENPSVCAHGRPITFRIPYQEIRKNVRRI